MVNLTLLKFIGSIAMFSFSKEYKEILKGDFLMIGAAFVWGMAFSVQRVASEIMEPLYYTGFRFFLGALILLPFCLKPLKKSSAKQHKSLLLEGFIAGVLLFIASAIQQIGLIYTAASNAGFITSLYVVLVPVFAVFLGVKAQKEIWIAVIFSALGLYLLSIPAGAFYLSRGDALIFVSSFFLAGHILYLNKVSSKHHSLSFAFFQFISCGIFSITLALFIETLTFKQIQDSVFVLFYGGFISVGLGYTLQVVAQKKSPPAHASCILSLESVFALLGGYFFLDEILSTRSFIGACLMFGSVIFLQIYPIFKPAR